MIALKSDKDIAQMRDCGRILARILKRLEASIVPGITTASLDEQAERLVKEEGVIGAFKGYRGFPATVCVSLNEEIVHGIPDGRTVNTGDIISVDLGIKYEGLYTDAAFTVGVGEIDLEKKNLIEVTRRALECGIAQARAGNRLYDISAAIQTYAERFGYSVVRQFVGHGIGTSLHEEPEVPNFGNPHQGALLQPGMVLAIEPMVNCGTWEIEVLENGWTAVTLDRRPSAHFEHTVAITEEGPEVLTR